MLALPADAFILAVLFGANMSYATPMAYKTNLLVMNAGNYRFINFVKVGALLTIIMWCTLGWLLAFFYVWWVLRIKYPTLAGQLLRIAHANGQRI